MLYWGWQRVPLIASDGKGTLAHKRRGRRLQAPSDRQMDDRMTTPMTAISRCKAMGIMKVEGGGKKLKDMHVY